MKAPPSGSWLGRPLQSAGGTAAAFAGTLALAVVAAHTQQSGDASTAGDLAVGLAFLGFGVALWTREREDDLTGPLMVATGFAWLLGDLVDGLALLHRGPLTQLLVAAPSGRPRSRLQWLVVGAGYVDATVASVGRSSAATIALAATLATVAIVRWTRARGLLRRALAVPAVVAVGIACVLALGVIAGSAHAGASLWCYEAVLTCSAAALWLDRRFGGWERAATTNVVIDLGATAQGGSLAAALGRTLGDRSLVVAYRAGDGYVDEGGRPMDLPPPASDRAVTIVDAAAGTAALVHDPDTLRAPGLADSVAAAVRLALDNAHLETQIRARMQEVRASRARLVAARESERRGLETRLHAHVGARLDAAEAVLLGLDESSDPLVASLPADLGLARGELDRFTAGLLPPDLGAGGLPVALPRLAAGARLPVAVDVACGRLDARVEEAAWFVCSEALANVVKHAGARRVEMRAVRRDGSLVISVDDDGRGGADVNAGRGLRGLTARVHALGGQLEVGDRPDGGTRLRASLPVEAPV